MLKKTAIITFSLTFILSAFSYVSANGFGDGLRGARLPQEPRLPHELQSPREAQEITQLPEIQTRVERDLPAIVCDHVADRPYMLNTCEVGPPPPLEPICGNDIVEEGEECDGNAPEGMLCNDQCLLEDEPFCGDGIVNQVDEECDLENGVTPGHTCSDQCLLVMLPITSQGYAVLTGTQEVPPLDVPGMGTAALRLDEDNNLWFDITVSNLTGPVTAAHFHGPAPEGENANVVFDITSSFDGAHAAGTWFALSDEELADLLGGLLYINVHTEENSGGEIRGQVHMNEAGVAFLDSAQEVPPLDLPGLGTGAFNLMNNATDLWFDITVSNLTGPVTAAHFHGPAPEGENANVVFDITSSFDGAHATGMWTGLSFENVSDLIGGLVYVNIHTADNPDGEIRGQVTGLVLPEITANVVINEVYYNVDDTHGTEADNEWIELYNKGPEPVNIMNWSIVDGQGDVDVLTEDIIMEAGDFILVTDQADTFSSFWSIPGSVPVIALDSNLGNGLGNTGDAVFLRNQFDQEVDAMSYGSNTDALDPSIGLTIEGYSLYRNPLGNDNNLESDWNDLAEPTPGEE